MFVSVLSEIGLQSLGQVAPENLEQVLKQRLASPDEEGEHRQDGDLLLRSLKAQAGNEALFLVHHHIDGDADQYFRGNVEELVDDGAGGGGDDLAPVTTRVSKQAAESGKAAGVLGACGHVPLPSAVWLSEAGRVADSFVF